MRPGARPLRRTSGGARPVDFGAFVRARSRAGDLVVQPRMGFSDPATMRAGLAATRAADAATVGTITLDSYTRVGELDSVESALRAGADLNGYPIVSYDRAVTGQVLAGIRDEAFPVQVRHGSAVPGDIFAALRRTLINATEGGPVSYCLPYGRTPLDESVRNWSRCAEDFAQLRESGVEPHLETFGGCMLGQLCPPSQLVAISVLEALFFCGHGIRSVSLSYAQQTHPEQDREAVAALRRLCGELLPTPNWHVVIYAYMGVYPTTDEGAYLLLDQGDAPRRRLRLGAAHREDGGGVPPYPDRRGEHRGAGVRGPDRQDGAGRRPGLHRGRLADIPGGQSPDRGCTRTGPGHRARTRTRLQTGRSGHPLLPAPGQSRPGPQLYRRRRPAPVGGIGRLPLAGLAGRARGRDVTSSGLIADLSYVQRAFDRAAMESGRAPNREGADIAPVGHRSLSPGE